MKIINSVKFLKMLQKRMGDDLVYNLVLDTDGEIYLIISAHKSKSRQMVDSQLHRCKLNKEDLEKSDFILATEIENIFKKIIIKKD